MKIMNENTALTMHKIAEDTIKEREQAGKIAAEQWVDSVVLEAVKKTAQRGEYHLDIQIPSSIFKCYAVDYIASGGFTVEHFGRAYSRYIRIKW